MPNTEELDVYRSDDFEEDVEKAGFHISPLGGLAISVSFMALIPIVLYPDKTRVMELIWILFIIGFAATRYTETPTIWEFETTMDALWWGIPLGAIIAIVETWVAARSVVFNSPLLALDITLLVISVGAVAEELLYRGGIQITVRTFFVRVGLPESVAASFAILFQAVLFSFGHMFVYETWNLIIALIVGGIMYGAAYEHKKDLTVPITAHIVVNVSGYKDTIINYLLTQPLLIALLLLFTIAIIIIKTRT